MLPAQSSTPLGGHPNPVGFILLAAFASGLVWLWALLGQLP